MSELSESRFLGRPALALLRGRGARGRDGGRRADRLPRRRLGGARVVVLGKTSNPPDPACPTDTPQNPCQAVGRVTAFQTNNGQQVSPYRARFDGRVVAWSITLSEPANSQRAFFNGLFGQPPEARIAILKRLPEPARRSTSSFARARSACSAPTSATPCASDSASRCG